MKWVQMLPGFRHWKRAGVVSLALLAGTQTAAAGNWADEENRDTNWNYSTAAGATNHITTAQQLAQFAYLVNQGTNFAGTVTMIAADSDLSAHEWTPAGYYNDAYDD